MKKKILAFVLAAIMILGFMPQNAKADDPVSKSVYVSISNDANYVSGSGSVMALKEVEVPYFDLSLYNLSEYYYNPNCYTGSTQTAGTSTTANGHVTLLHAMIYLTEKYYHNAPDSSLGKGWLRTNGYLKKAGEATTGNESMIITGTVGSIYFTKFWNMDQNFNYYINYVYPLGHSGWGATADQIDLNTNDIISIAHFTDWSFYQDANSVVSYARQGTGQASQTGNFKPFTTSDSSVDMTFYHAKADFVNFNQTIQTAYGSGVSVYYTDISTISSGNPTTWTSAGTLTSGSITLNISGWQEGHTYIVAITGQPGATYTNAICCAPGGILITKD